MAVLPIYSMLMCHAWTNNSSEVQSGKYSTFHIAYPLVQTPYEFLHTNPFFPHRPWQSWRQTVSLSQQPPTPSQHQHPEKHPMIISPSFPGKNIKRTLSSSASRSWYIKLCTAIITLPPWNTPINSGNFNSQPTSQLTIQDMTSLSTTTMTNAQPLAMQYTATTTNKG